MAKPKKADPAEMFSVQKVGNTFDVVATETNVTVKAFKTQDKADRLCGLLNASYQLFLEGDKVAPGGLDAPPVKVKTKKAS